MLALIYHLCALAFSIFWLVAKVTGPLFLRMLVKLMAIFCGMYAMISIAHYFNVTIAV